jgi:hypothetical protein
MVDLAQHDGINIESVTGGMHGAHVIAGNGVEEG